MSLLTSAGAVAYATCGVIVAAGRAPRPTRARTAATLAPMPSPHRPPTATVVLGVLVALAAVGTACQALSRDPSHALIPRPPARARRTFAPALPEPPEEPRRRRRLLTRIPRQGRTPPQETAVATAR